MKHDFLTFSDLFGVLKKRWVFILAITLLCGVVAFGVTQMIPKKYACTSSYAVKNLQSTEYIDHYGISSSQSAASETMAEQFSALIVRSDALFDAAVQNHDLGLSAGEVRRMVTAKTVGLGIFTVTVEGEDPAVCEKVIRALEAELPRSITRTAWASVGEDFVCLDLLTKAAPAKQSAPHYKMITFIAALLGAFLSYVVFLLVFLFGTRVNTEEDVTRVLSAYPVLGRVPHWGSQKKTGGESDAG